MARFDTGNIVKKSGRVLKATAALVAAAAFMVASMAQPAPDATKVHEEIFTGPAPVVMTIDEVDEAVVEETSEEEEKAKKMGFFTKLKLAFYSFCAAIGAWVAHKIPWKKIFNKRNLYILLALVCLGLAAYYLGPEIVEYLSSGSEIQ